MAKRVNNSAPRRTPPRKTLADPLTSPAGGQPTGRSLQIRPDPTSPAPYPDLKRVTTVNPNGIGSSGTTIFSGQIKEEYLNALTGYQAAKIYDKMRRQESQVRMVVNAFKNPIRKAHLAVEPPKDASDDEKEQAEFIEHVLFCGMDRPWKQVWNEVLSMIDFGHSVFEVVHKPVIADPEWGTYVGIGQLAFRSQKTIYYWNVDPSSGALASVTQIVNGDLGRYVDIPAEFLVVFSLEQEGDNYEGISALRACYGPYLRKQTYLQLMAIGIEKFAVPTPVGKFPAGQENSEQFTRFKQALEDYTSHETNYITLPAGDWAIDWNDSHFDPEKVQKAIDSEDRAMVKSILANFLELGMSTSGGSWALSFDQSDFFLSGIEHVAELACDVISRRIIKPLIEMNYGPQKRYPVLKHSGISDEGGKDLAEALKALADAKVIIPDDELEEQVRKRFHLPAKSELGQRVTVATTDVSIPPPDNAAPGAVPPAAKPPAPAPAPGAPPAPGKQAVKASEARMRLAERKARQQISAASSALLPVMQDGLRTMKDGMLKQLMANLRGATVATRINAAKDLTPTGSAQYRQALVSALADVAGQALAAARREVPKAKNVRLAESTAGIRLADVYSLDELPADVQRRIRNRAQLLVDTQGQSLQKAIAFQFSGSEDSTDSFDLIESDCADAAEDVILGAAIQTAATNAGAFTVNEARSAFFFDQAVLPQIESFTFVNGDPVSPICQDLAGTTFAKDDPEAQRYFPPLHHNCKSYIVANLVGNDNPALDDNGLQPSSADLNKYATLAEEHEHADEGCLRARLQECFQTDSTGRSIGLAPGVEYRLEEPDETTEVHVYSRDGRELARQRVTYAPGSQRKILSSKPEAPAC